MQNCSKLFVWRTREEFGLNERRRKKGKEKKRKREGRNNDLQNLKSVDIKNTDDGLVATLPGIDVIVDLLHNPAEQTVVGGLGQRIACKGGLLLVHGSGNILASARVVADCPLSEGLFQQLWLDFKHLRRCGQF